MLCITYLSIKSTYLYFKNYISIIIILFLNLNKIIFLQTNYACSKYVLKFLELYDRILNYLKINLFYHLTLLTINKFKQPFKII